MTRRSSSPALAHDAPAAPFPSLPLLPALKLVLPKLPVLILLLILSACGETAAGEPDPVTVREFAIGDPAPTILNVRDDARITIAWLMTQADCLTCEAAPLARELRGLQRRFGDRIAIHVVVVDQETRIVERFLRQERVRAAVSMLTPAEYGDTFGRLPLPRVYLLDSGRVAGVMGGGAAISVASVDGGEQRGGTSLSQTIERILGET